MCVNFYIIKIKKPVTLFSDMGHSSGQIVMIICSTRTDVTRFTCNLYTVCDDFLTPLSMQENGSGGRTGAEQK